MGCGHVHMHAHIILHTHAHIHTHTHTHTRPVVDAPHTAIYRSLVQLQILVLFSICFDPPMSVSAVCGAKETTYTFTHNECIYIACMYECI